MSRLVFQRSVAAATVALALGHAALGASYRLSDHPGSNEAPPPYGLRLDGLFANNGGAGGVTTFSFNAYNDVILTVLQNGPNLNITVNGTVRGGEDTGAGYGFGLGDYAFSMTYTATVQTVSDGWRVVGPGGGNFGTLTGLTGALAGTTFNLFDVQDQSRTFVFRQDDHRLAGTGLEGLGLFVGRGWLDFDGSTSGGTRDVLFVGDLIIPSPLAGVMGGVGMLGLAARRRR